MRIGISRFSSTPEQSHRVLAAAREFGFEGVQLKPSQYESFVASPAAFRDRYGDLAPLARGGLIVYPGNDPHAWPAKLDAVIPFAGAINAEHICLCSGVYGSGATDDQARTVAETLTTIGRRARGHGLVISVHNHAASVVETEADIARMLAMLDPAVCGLTLDTAHAAKAGIPSVHRLVERFRAHLINVHLKDLGPDGKFCALGEGTLDLPPILSALAAIGYEQWLIVDEETVGMDTDTAFRTAAECLERVGAM